MSTGETDVVAQEGNNLGRFGHHPNPAIDFCTEVDCIAGLSYDVGVGLATVGYVLDRVERAMAFTVGGDIPAMAAKDRLREIERHLKDTRLRSQGGGWIDSALRKFADFWDLDGDLFEGVTYVRGDALSTAVAAERARVIDAAIAAMRAVPDGPDDFPFRTYWLNLFEAAIRDLGKGGADV